MQGLKSVGCIVVTLVCTDIRLMAQEPAGLETSFMEMAEQQAASPQGTAGPFDPTVSPMNAGPTPMPGHGHAGVSPLNYSSDPDSATMGPRLDTTFSLMRDVETAVFLSEKQATGLVGGTIIPFQTPCMIFGLRGLGGYGENMSVAPSVGAFSIDSFIGSRYKRLYYKLGYLYDNYAFFQKMGLTSSFLTEVPILGAMTADLAFGFRTEEDEIDRASRDPFTGRARRVESADMDYQFRVGKFFNQNFQMGVTWNSYRFNHTQDDYGVGAFANIYWGRWRFGGDVTGGTEGLRGYMRVAYSFGAHPCKRPYDCNVSGVDVVDWVSRATDRDPSIRLRDSFTGPLVPAP